MSEHSSKRQRLTGSFSPASPPYHASAKTDQTKPIVHPNTPTSPPYLPMNSQSHGAHTTSATAPGPDMTPPSSVHKSSHPHHSASSANNPMPFPTPASTTGVMSSSNLDSDGDALMDDPHDFSHRHSNHNRQSRDDVWSRRGGVAAAEGIFGSQLFKLCEKAPEVSRPHGSQNLIELYGLNKLANSVARNDPVTGEKINKLRKSYEGHIKLMKIAGKPKATKMEGMMTGLMQFPDFEYDMQKVNGKEIQGALTPDKSALSSRFDSLLNGAFAGMAPGSLPPHEASKFKAYMATDETVKAKGPDSMAERSAATTPNPANASAASRISRPERAGSKRQYNDSSFQGYGEGFTDDFGADSTGGEDNPQGNLAKKRRLAFERTSHQVEVGGVRR